MGGPCQVQERRRLAEAERRGLAEAPARRENTYICNETHHRALVAQRAFSGLALRHYWDLQPLCERFDLVPEIVRKRLSGGSYVVIAPRKKHRGIGRWRLHTKGAPLELAAQLAQLAGMTTLSIDTGDLDILEEFGATGLITDATTNPLFVSQAGLSGDARYVAFVDTAIEYAKANADGSDAILELAMDRLAVELGTHPCIVPCVGAFQTDAALCLLGSCHSMLSS